MGSSKVTYACITVSDLTFQAEGDTPRKEKKKRAFNKKPQLFAEFSTLKYPLENSFVCITEASCWF